VFELILQNYTGFMVSSLEKKGWGFLRCEWVFVEMSASTQTGKRTMAYFSARIWAVKFVSGLPQR